MQNMADRPLPVHSVGRNGSFDCETVFLVGVKLIFICEGNPAFGRSNTKANCKAKLPQRYQRSSHASCNKTQNRDWNSRMHNHCHRSFHRYFRQQEGI